MRGYENIHEYTVFVYDRITHRIGFGYLSPMNTHLRRLIQELKNEGWEYIAAQTNGSPHFVHPQFGKVAVASTPADWEDECRFTKQRARKAMRRAVQVTPEPAAPMDSLQDIFAEIDALESQLRAVSDEAPRLLGEIQALWAPCIEKMVAERRAMLTVLGRESCSPRWKRKQVQAIGELAMVIAEGTHAHLGVDLGAEFPFLEVLRKDKGKAREEALQAQDAEPDDFDAFDEEDWERWFDQHESGSSTTWHPEGEPQAGKGKPKQSTHKAPKGQTHNEDGESAKPPQDPKALGKSLYHGLARELHPDKTTDAAEQAARTHLMKQLNAAHAKGDLRTLLSLLHQHGTDAQKASMADAERMLEQSLRQQRDDLKIELMLAIEELPELDADWRSLLSQPKAREALLRREKRTADEEVQHMRHLYNAIADPGGLGDFLRRTDLEDWLGMF